MAPLRLATATVNAYKAAAGSSAAVVTFLSGRSYTVRPFFVVFFFQQIWTFSIVGFLFKRLTFLPYSWASANVITPHTEIPECQRFPRLRSTPLSYVHPKAHAQYLQDLKFASLKHEGFCCLGMICLFFVFFWFLFFFLERQGKLQGISGCQNLRSDIVIPAGWPSGVCLKGEGRKKKKQSRRLNHIFLPIRPCAPTSIITATCFIFSIAVLSDSHPRAMCCSVRLQIP